MKPIFSDMTPGYKALLLFTFYFVSAMLFTILGVQLAQLFFGVDLTEVDLEVLNLDQQSIYQKAFWLTTLIYTIGAHLVSTLTFSQLAEIKGVEVLKFRKVSGTLILLIILGAGFMTAWGSLLLQWLNDQVLSQFGSIRDSLDEISEKAQSQQAIMLSGNLWEAAINFILLGLIVPLCEEFLFRGGIQRYLIQASKKVWVGVLTTGFIFALIHAEFDGFLVRFAMGVLLGYVFVWTGSIWSSILLHAAYNLTGIAITYIDNAYHWNEDFSVVMPILGFVLSLGLVLLLYRKKTTYLFD